MNWNDSETDALLETPLDGDGSSVPASQLEDLLNENVTPLSLSAFPPSALAYWVARLPEKIAGPVVVLVTSDREAEALAAEIRYFRGDRNRAADPFSPSVRVFPSRSRHRAQVIGKMEGVARRMETLWALKNAQDHLIIVASARAILEKLPPPELLDAETEYRVLREEVDP